MTRTSAEFLAETMATLSSAELAEINARSDAMTERAAIYEHKLEPLVCRLAMLANTEFGTRWLLMLAELIALEQARREALGVPAGTWQEALQTYGVLTDTTIAALKKQFCQQEASN